MSDEITRCAATCTGQRQQAPAARAEPSARALGVGPQRKKKRIASLRWFDTLTIAPNRVEGRAPERVRPFDRLRVDLSEVEGRAGVGPREH